MQKMGNSVQKREKKEHSDWLTNKGTHRDPIRLEQLTGQNNNETKWRPLSEDLAHFFACLIILLWERASKFEGAAHLWKCK